MGQTGREKRKVGEGDLLLDLGTLREDPQDHSGNIRSAGDAVDTLQWRRSTRNPGALRSAWAEAINRQDGI